MRLLLIADSHLGFDLPLRPRVKRRRRGLDFLANYQRALQPACKGDVDIVVHGGDVFDRPDVPASLAYQALEPLRRVAERGVPVFIVPGNHERSRLPHARFALHPNVHVYDQPRTFVIDVAGVRVALAGFPYERRNVRGRFDELLARTQWQRAAADVRLLCLHHCFEGATVGPQNFTFTTADDVIRVQDVPTSFAAVLSGHIHRHQVLSRDLRKRPVAVPVFYPGSIERTAWAELGETKGYMIVHVGGSGAADVGWQFHELPARPMIAQRVNVSGMSPFELECAVRSIVAAAPDDAVLGIRIDGQLSDAQSHVVTAARLRRIVPESMNLELHISRQAAGVFGRDPKKRPAFRPRSA